MLWENIALCNKIFLSDQMKKVQYLLCVTSDSDLEKLYTFYCLLSVEGFFSFLPQISRLSPVWRLWLLHVMSSARGQFVKSIRADILFSLYLIRKSGTSLYILHQIKSPPQITTLILKCIHLNVDFRLCVSVTCYDVSGDLWNLGSLCLVTLSKEMSRLFKCDQ